MNTLSTRNLYRIFCLFIVATLFDAASADAGPLIHDGETLAICGDSITEQRQYSVFIETYLLACKPVQNVRTVQVGWSGEWAGQFALRIGSDVLPFKPAIVTTCYGMNDGAYMAMKPETGTKYHDSMKAAVDALKAGGVQTVVIGSPGAVDTFTYKKHPGSDAQTYNQTLAALRDIAASVAKETGSHFANVHDPMVDAMAKAKARYGDKFAFAGGDGVHPGAAGHLVMAYAFLKALGCNGDLGTITLDLITNHNSATGGHTILSAENSTIQLESKRIPFCFSGDATAADSPRSILPFVPFIDELDRLTLVVKGAGSGKLRITWGNQSAEFTAEQLAKGINLVAEFPSNPFNEAFGRVQNAARAQQEFETYLTKVILHNAPDEIQKIPDASQQIDGLVAAAMKHDQVLADATAAEADKPVQHTIKIEPVQ